jgi:hypothetical protein
MSTKHKTQNRNWTENMSEHITWVRISVSAKRWTQSLSRDQENEHIVLIELKKVNIVWMSRKCDDKEDGGLQVFCRMG